MSLCRKIVVVSFVLFLIACTTAFYQDCPPCEYVTCPPVACNSSSTIWRQYLGVCGCCILCGKNEGEKCGGTNNAGGNCIPGQSCNYRAGITLGDERMGLCEPDDCRRHACGYRKRCNNVSNIVGCRCPVYRCDGKWNPACGNDGNTYDSVCHLQRAECTNNKFIGIYHFGSCLQPKPTPARPTTLSKNELDEEDDLFGQLPQPTVATNAPRSCLHNGEFYTANNQLVKIDECLYRVCNYKGVLREVLVPGCQGVCNSPEDCVSCSSGPPEPDYGVDKPAVHGGWSEWSLSECEGFCHNGTQNRTRTCTNPAPKYEGRNCTGVTWENVSCIPSGCEAIVCNYSDWSSWSDCPVTCGTGTQRRTRSLLSPSPDETLCILEEVKTCTRPECFYGRCQRRSRPAFFTDSRNCTSYRMFPDYFCDGTCSRGGGSNCCKPNQYYSRAIPVQCPGYPWYEDSAFTNQIWSCSCTECAEESGEGQLG